jgi:hypothetical protein
MERRIAEQIEQIKRLEQSGKDTAQAKNRLTLLRHALDEMRIQVGQLSPTAMDQKRSGRKDTAPRKK